jgi:hypothetical protein
VLLGYDDKDRIARQAGRWEFSFPTQTDRDQHDAVRAAVAYLEEHADELPDVVAPRNATQLAVRAIESHDQFLRGDAPLT